MKKIFLSLMMCFTFLLVSCGKNDEEIVMENMSEVTQNYFYAENEKLYASISCGFREKNYFLDGKSDEKVQFSLLCLNFFEEVDFDVVNVILVVDEMEYNFELEKSLQSSEFMVDCEKIAFGSKKIALKYQNFTLNMQEISKDFKVDFKKAIEIGCENFAKQIENLRKNSSFDGECYLKILDKKKNGFEDVFWCFSILDKNGNNYSVVISTVDGKTLAKSV